MTKKKLIRITTVPLSLDKLLEGQLRFMTDYYDVVAVSSEKEYLERIGKRENVATHHLEMTRKITPVQDVIAVIKMYFYFKKVKPFIVHTHTPKAGIVGMMAAKLAGVPHRLHTVAGLPLLEATGLKRKILDFVEKLTYSCATKVYPNSKALLQIIQNNSYCKISKLKVIANGSSNGINTSLFNSEIISENQKFELKNHLKINENDFVFIFVGRIVTDKGINELVQAFSKLNQEINAIKLLLVGPFEEDLNPLKPETLEIIKAHSSIISVGYQNDVRPYFSISNALVFPSYREGFPNVVMQAGAMNLPSIVSDINGCNEIIENNKNGIIIPVKNSTALFVTMKELVQNSVNYQFMKSNSRSLIENRFEQKIVWEALLNEYESLEQ
jgi:glycosyltransferase involved in cell wall biosynthesis